MREKGLVKANTCLLLYKDSANLKAERLACLDYYAHATLLALP